MLILFLSRRAVRLAACTMVICILSGGSAKAQSHTSTVKTVVPQEIDEPLSNPYMGWGIWAGPRYYDG
ncbi:MAG: hypothetical protein ABSG54_19965, partial [Terriglobia bacterium]